MAKAPTSSDCVSRYNILLDRARKIEVQKLSSIDGCIQFASAMLSKANKLKPHLNDEKFVLYNRICIYIDEKLPSHPLWSSVKKEQKEQLRHVANRAFEHVMSLKKDIVFNIIEENSSKRQNFKTRSKDVSIGTEFKYFNGNRSANLSDDTTESYLCKEEEKQNLNSSQQSENIIPEKDTLGTLIQGNTDQHLHNYNLHSRPQLSAVASCPSGTDNYLILSQELVQRRLSHPPESSLPEKSYAALLPFCSKCVNKTNRISRINCTCMLESNAESHDKETQTTESSVAINLAKRYDAFLLSIGDGDVIGNELLHRLTKNGFRICTLKQNKRLGEDITRSYASLIYNSSYVIAIVSIDLLEDSITSWLLDRAFFETLWRRFSCLLPIVLQGCDLPYAMQNIVSYKIADNNTPDMKTIFEQVCQCLK
ncbi:uncharacterized protein [Antedon mediterranea]